MQSQFTCRTYAQIEYFCQNHSNLHYRPWRYSLESIRFGKKERKQTLAEYVLFQNPLSQSDIIARKLPFSHKGCNSTKIIKFTYT